MFISKYFTYFTCISQKVKHCVNVKSSTYYFYVKTKILPNFQICISVHSIFFLVLLIKLIAKNYENEFIFNIGCDIYKVQLYVNAS